MTEAERKEAARRFINHWRGKGNEKQDSQLFWMSLLQDVYGMENVGQNVQFERPVIVDGQQKYIDVYLPETRVLIEQKGIAKDLGKPELQSGGAMLTPYQQAKRYANNMPLDEMPRYIVTCNFAEFRIYDQNKPGQDPAIIPLEALQEAAYRLEFLVKKEHASLSEEMKISMQAGEIVGKLYDAFYRQYKNPENEHSQKSLNALCVRLVFCLYAEDSGLFGSHAMFHDYLASYKTGHMRKALIDLFKVLDQPENERDPYLEPELAAFPYVNGGLFSDESIEIPQFTDEIRTLLLENASTDFDWSSISPTIFGAVFESTLNPDTRRSGGMHYTSIENIHKVIDPLFLDELRAELIEIEELPVIRTRKARLEQFQEKLASLTFLDPACGSGNFLTETYLSLRRLENEVLRQRIAADRSEVAGQIMLDFGGKYQVMVSIGQFYGIEINDFAVTVAKTALWISEEQMIRETQAIIHTNIEFLPLKSYANIVQGNALRMDWETMVPKERLSYIMGNPPFVGGMYMSPTQKKEIRDIFSDLKGAGEIDYVCAWYKLAADFMKETSVKAAFVSTNSITQGEQVPIFWKYVFNRYCIQIAFAYKTFIWNSEAKDQAKVHCVIIGFSGDHIKNFQKRLYSADGNIELCTNISPYLTNSQNYFIESRSKPLCNVPSMKFGSMPRDGGGFILSPEERLELIEKEPLSEKWIRPYVGANEFLNNKKRYCLWLLDASPREIALCPMVKKRIEAVRLFRIKSKASATRKFAETPTLFCQIAQPDTNYIIVPETSSGRRSYLPIGFQHSNVIASNLVFLIPNATLYHFGILMSNVHNAWMRQTAGRLKSDYRYAKDIVYNNFPWPSPTPDQKARIEQTAQEILDARALYPDSSLADLYDPLTMPPELRAAHNRNNIAVMKAYGFPTSMSEADCVAALMKMYQSLTSK
ncbi:MAG: class I SAM-dependent DNA methyltransferase [Lachnospiraceae bacterium]|nr:class I SAM-dependent DNA methyltransferase [Lachnospiraceae bacterium]